VLLCAVRIMYVISLFQLLIGVQDEDFCGRSALGENEAAHQKPAESKSCTESGRDIESSFFPELFLFRVSCFSSVQPIFY
jgi:hypothetical protein